jgi:hypothetical protein
MKHNGESEFRGPITAKLCENWTARQILTALPDDMFVKLVEKLLEIDEYNDDPVCSVEDCDKPKAGRVNFMDYCEDHHPNAVRGS